MTNTKGCLSIFPRPTFDSYKILKFKPLNILCFESTSHIQKRSKVTKCKVRESLLKMSACITKSNKSEDIKVKLLALVTRYDLF